MQPRIVNPLGSPFKFKFWENAMLAPGKANSVSPDLRLIFPANQVTVHSTGDPALPQAGQTMAWPVVNGKDLSRLGNWQNYLGVFATPPTATPGTGAFAGVYDPAVDEGMVRVFPADIAKGVKLFAPRGADGLDPDALDRRRVDLRGAARRPDADLRRLVRAGPGGRRHVERVLVSRGQDRRPDLRQRPRGPGAHAFCGWRACSGLFPTTAMTGKLTVTLPGAAPETVPVQISPDHPFSASSRSPPGPDSRAR